MRSQESWLLWWWPKCFTLNSLADFWSCTCLELESGVADWALILRRTVVAVPDVEEGTAVVDELANAGTGLVPKEPLDELDENPDHDWIVIEFIDFT